MTDDYSLHPSLSEEDVAPTHWSTAHALLWLQPPKATDHKIRRGVLAARIGSSHYPGAAVLGVSAAWRTGIGMVRYVPQLGDAAPAFGLPTPAAAVLAVRPETLFGVGDSDAWLLGSGTDPHHRAAEETAFLTQLHRGTTPLVVDAGALDTALTRDSTSAPAVLTPHLGEFRRLWEAANLEPESKQLGEGDIELAVARLAQHLNATILLKGSTSIGVNPQGKVVRVGPATPWLATAGTGDVLAGILGALVAHHSRAVCAFPGLLVELAATAALVHDAAARIASGDDSSDPQSCGGSPITALDVANAVPEALYRINLAG